MPKNLLPEMIGVSRNCRLTLQIHSLIQEKLDDNDLESFRRWIQLINDEKEIDVNREKKQNQYRRF